MSISNYVIYNGDLYHHGVKGMRWGVRRFQRKDGSLTPAGKQKSKHRLALEERYRNKGFTQKQAEDKANKRIKMEKVMLATAGLTVAACAAYAVNKNVKNRTDQIIKTGEKLQRVERWDTQGELHDTFFVSKGKHDNKRYKGLLAMNGHAQTGKAYLLKLEAQGDVKVASKDRAVKMFGEMYKNDPSFRDSVKEYTSSTFSGKNKVNPDKLTDKNIRKMYENFNSNLIRIRENSPSRPDNQFFNKMKSSGYGAIQDINDMKFSGYKARNPLIIFDNSNKSIVTKTVSEISMEDALKGGMKEFGKATGERFVSSYLNTYGPVVATGLTAGVATSYATNRQPQNTNTK